MVILRIVHTYIWMFSEKIFCLKLKVYYFFKIFSKKGDTISNDFL